MLDANGFFCGREKTNSSHGVENIHDTDKRFTTQTQSDEFVRSICVLNATTLSVLNPQKGLVCEESALSPVQLSASPQRSKLTSLILRWTDSKRQPSL